MPLNDVATPQKPPFLLSLWDEREQSEWSGKVGIPIPRWDGGWEPFRDRLLDACEQLGWQVSNTHPWIRTTYTWPNGDPLYLYSEKVPKRGERILWLTDDGDFMEHCALSGRYWTAMRLQAPLIAGLPLPGFFSSNNYRQHALVVPMADPTIEPEIPPHVTVAFLQTWAKTLATLPATLDSLRSPLAQAA